MATRLVARDYEPIFGRHCCRLWIIFTVGLFFAGVQAHGKQLSLRPIAFGIYRSDGGTWTTEQLPIRLMGWGVATAKEYGPLTAAMEIVFMRFFGLDTFPNRFVPEKGYSWAAHLTRNQRERDSNYADMKISYRVGDIEASFGKFSRSWGPGRSALMISHKAPTYPQFGFEWQVIDNLQFSYFHGNLYSGLSDSSRIFVYQGKRVPALDRYVVAHRLEWSPTKSLRLSASEMVIYGGRSMELVYLMPFILFMSSENFLQDRDNVMMGIDIAWCPLNNLRVYGAFMMDEWKPEITFAEKDHNWFGWQGGVDWCGIIGKSDWFALEYTWTDHRVYRHKFPVNHAYSHDYPLGFWAGPHAQVLEVEYGFEWRGFKIVFNLTDAKRGQATKEIVADKYGDIIYERFKGPTERLRDMGLAVGREVWSRIRLEGGFSSILWENPGFNPLVSSPTRREGIQKSTLTLAVYYNFRIQGTKHPYR